MQHDEVRQHLESGVGEIDCVIISMIEELVAIQEKKEIWTRISCLCQNKLQHCNFKTETIKVIEDTTAKFCFFRFLE